LGEGRSGESSGKERGDNKKQRGQRTSTVKGISDLRVKEDFGGERIGKDGKKRPTTKLKGRAMIRDHRGNWTTISSIRKRIKEGKKKKNPG